MNELSDNTSISASLLPDCKKSAKIPEFLPKNGELFSLKHILMNCVEIRSVPKKPFVRTLVEYTSDESERRRLEELCSRQGGNNYLSVVRGKNLCLLDILIAFPTCQPPIGKFCLLLQYFCQIKDVMICYNLMICLTIINAILFSSQNEYWSICQYNKLDHIQYRRGLNPETRMMWLLPSLISPKKMCGDSLEKEYRLDGNLAEVACNEAEFALFLTEGWGLVPMLFHSNSVFL